jgi:hypothetical protein
MQQRAKLSRTRRAHVAMQGRWFAESRSGHPDASSLTQSSPHFLEEQLCQKQNTQQQRSNMIRRPNRTEQRPIIMTRAMLSRPRSTQASRTKNRARPMRHQKRRTKSPARNKLIAAVQANGQLLCPFLTLPQCRGSAIEVIQNATMSVSVQPNRIQPRYRTFAMIRGTCRGSLDRRLNTAEARVARLRQHLSNA